MDGAFTSIAFSPLLPWPIVAGLGALALLAIGLCVWRRARGMWLRLLALGVLVLTLLNPQAVREERAPLRDIAVVLVDETRSQAIDARQAQSAAALDKLEESLGRLEGLDVRYARIDDAADGGDGAAPGDGRGTRLFDTLERVLAEVPEDRLAGVVAITDGQVHDLPEAPAEADLAAPLHVLLTGRRGETDRRLTIRQKPGYGIVGQSVPVTIRVDDLPVTVSESGGSGTATVTLRRDGEPPRELRVTVGRDHTIEIPIEHGGTTMAEFAAAELAGELSTDNNRAVVSINGVRDRLRVLLVSGQPHPGERTWRRLLKADPSVDLIHFTILRPPEKDDLTPLNELALITFPIRELFQVKLREFDLIIFDRYRYRGVLPSIYLQNIADYVQEGGAVMLAVGPDYATPFSLHATPLGTIMPAEPTGEVEEQGFRPEVTDLGLRHPVTAALPEETGDAESWGRWFRRIDARVTDGTVLMNGTAGEPLLVLDRVGEGRVALLLSDHIWLWSRGFEGGGPQAELLRRLAHWLMKEPDLEENDLRATIARDRMTIERRSLEDVDAPVTVTSPSGETFTLPLQAEAPGRDRATVPVEEIGLYRLDDGRNQAFAAAGIANPVELSDLRATGEKLAPIVEASGGGMFWLADGLPALRRVAPGRDSAGEDWIGLRENRDHVVTGVGLVPLLPALLVLLLGLGGLMAAWRRESR